VAVHGAQELQGLAEKHKVGVVTLSQICRGFVAWKEKETILVRISYFYLLLNFGHEE
jgi:hypothetical protein